MLALFINAAILLVAALTFHFSPWHRDRIDQQLD
jgi:Mn2+/Fe2+ NRAMP family transporter